MRLLLLASVALAPVVIPVSTAVPQTVTPPGTIVVTCDNAVNKGASANCNASVAGGIATYSSSNGQSGSNTIAPSAWNFTVPTQDDGAVTGDQTVNVTATFGPFTAITAFTEKDIYQKCWDNSVILLTAQCTVDNPMVGQALGVGAPDIPTTDFDINKAVKASWDCIKNSVGASICGQPAPVTQSFEDLGAFRFICRHTNLKQDDPTVFPNQPGKSHWHDQTGVYNWSAYSTYGKLRTGGGGSGCNDIAGEDKNPAEANWAGNRTPYWQPALVDGHGNAILADYTSFYYKRRPENDPSVSNPSFAFPAGHGFLGWAVPLPNGLKFLFGNHPENPDAPSGLGDPFRANIDFNCVNPNGSLKLTSTTGGAYPALLCASQTPGGWFEVRAGAPNCWDGHNLDMPDHRSHMAYPIDSHLGYKKCDPGHPYVVPTFTYAAFYTILPTDDIASIHFSSDEDPATGKVKAGKVVGWSFHVDYGPASWDPVILKEWTDNCINKKLNCSGGDLGDGRQLKGASVPYYPGTTPGTYVASWHNPIRKVALPAMTGM